MEWRIDLAISGPGWLERSGTLAARFVAMSTSSPGTALPTGASLSYTLTDATGSTVASGTASKSGDTILTTSIALGSALDPSVAYVERVTGTIDGDAVDCYREARVSRHAASRRTPPITSAAVSAGNPLLAVYPSGSTSWEVPIVEAWAELSYHLWAVGPKGDIWTPGQLASPTLWLARSIIYSQFAVTAGNAYALQAAAFRALYERWWESARLLTDGDTSGTPDGPAVTVGGMGPSAGPIMR